MSQSYNFICRVIQPVFIGTDNNTSSIRIPFLSLRISPEHIFQYVPETEHSWTFLVNEQPGLIQQVPARPGLMETNPGFEVYLLTTGSVFFLKPF